MEHMILDIPGIPEPVYLEKVSETRWESTGEYLLEIEEKEDDTLSLIRKDDTFEGTEDAYLLEIFLKEQVSRRKEAIDQEVAGIEPEVGNEENESEIPRPDFDPEQIRVDPKVFSLLDVVRFIDRDRIDLSPDFQRHFVWKHSQQSRMIESILLRIPLPAFYLSEDEDGLYQVIDGLQRLTTIHNFMNNRLKLRGLEYLYDCEGKNFKGLAPRYQRRLEDTQLSFNVIAPTTPISVKFEIFKRINEGGKPLNRQEIRNSMAKPKVRKFIQRLASSDQFGMTTSYSVRSLRMEDQELVLRFLGFYLNKFVSDHPYKGDMEMFLDETLVYLNRKLSDTLEQEIEKNFYSGMANAFWLFEKYAFRKIKKEHVQSGRKALINKSLFTVWSVLLSQLDVELIFGEKDYFRCMAPKLAEEIEENPQYFDALTNGTNQANKIEYGFLIARKMIEETLKMRVDYA